MLDAVSKDLLIRKIELACYVPSGTHKPVHIDRPSSGFAYQCNRSAVFQFVNNERMTIKEGDIIFLPKGSSYTVSMASPGDCYAVNFQIDLLPCAAPMVYHSPHPHQMLELFKSIEGIWRDHRPGYRLKCMSLLYQMIYLMESESSSDYKLSVKKDLILPAVNDIHTHYTEKTLEVSSLAKACGITPEYFRSIFKQIYGVSPIKYINQLRLSRARELLASNLYSVSEAAALSGYNEIAYFSREFKKAFGMCPSDYARTCRK